MITIRPILAIFSLLFLMGIASSSAMAAPSLQGQANGCGQSKTTSGSAASSCEKLIGKNKNVVAPQPVCQTGYQPERYGTATVTSITNPSPGVLIVTGDKFTCGSQLSLSDNVETCDRYYGCYSGLQQIRNYYDSAGMYEGTPTGTWNQPGVSVIWSDDQITVYDPTMAGVTFSHLGVADGWDWLYQQYLPAPMTLQ